MEVEKQRGLRPELRVLRGWEDEEEPTKKAEK